MLDRKLDFIDKVQRVSRPAKLPVVFTPAEARAVLAHLKGDYRLMAELLYGSGLRLMECARLRVKDIDFGYNRITVREGKGLRERVSLLPRQIQRPLRDHLERIKELHRQDLAQGGGKVYLPFALNGNIPTPKGIGSGNTYSRRQNHRSTHFQARCDVIMFPKKTCRTRFNWRFVLRE